MGAGGSGASFLLFNMVIVQVDAAQAAVVLNLIPVFGVVSAVVFLGEGMTGRDALGTILIGSSVLYFTMADRRDATARAGPAEPPRSPSPASGSGSTPPSATATPSGCAGRCPDVPLAPHV